jgi:hypothetical protein
MSNSTGSNGTVTDPVVAATELFTVSDIAKSSYAHYIIFGCSIFALAWAAWCTFLVHKVEVKPEQVLPNDDENDKADPANAELPWTSEACCERMLQTNGFIKQGAKTFLKQEYTYLGVFCVLFAVLLLCTVDMPWAEGSLPVPYTTISFLIGAGTSMLAGFIGMMIATTANVKVTYLCNVNI